MATTNIIILLTVIINIFLGFFVILKNKRDFRNIYLSLFIFSIALWSFSMVMLLVSSNVWWGRLTFSFTALAYIFYVMFLFFFLRKTIKVNKIVRNIFLIVGMVVVAISPTSLIEVDTIRRASPGAYGGIDIILGRAYLFVVLYYLSGLIYFVFLMVSGYLKSFGIYKSQMKYFFFGIIVFAVSSLITNLVLPFFNIFSFNNIGPVFSVVMIVSMVYAITRYRLMDIKTIIKKSSVFAILVIIIAALLVFLSSLLASMLGNYLPDSSHIISSIIVAVLIAIFFQPIRNFLEKITNKFLFSKGYNPSDVLGRINEITTSTIDLNILLKSAGDSLESTFHCSRVAFPLIDGVGKKGELRNYYQNGFDQKTLEVFVKDKVQYLPWYFADNREIKVIDELKARYDAGEYKPKSVELLMGLYDLNISLVVPLSAKEKLIGLILVGNKKSGDAYNSEDLRVINIIAGQLGIAIENARLYQEQKKFNVNLKAEVKKATAKLETANKELQRLDDAKSEFLSIASHQLRTPLTITKGYVSMMDEGSFGKVPKLIKENLKKIYIANERLLSLVENLLDISRIEAGRLEFDLKPIDLNEVVAGLVQDFSAKAKDKGLKLEFYPEPNAPKCVADGQKIKEVISNLIDNSVKYTPAGEIMVGTHTESQSLVFSCQDNGMGVEPEDLPRLFNKFVRGKGMMTVHTEGTGLGLYFARVVIENMGGRIWAESPGKNKGSKFSFSLPLADKSQAKKVKSATEEKIPA